MTKTKFWITLVTGLILGAIGGYIYFEFLVERVGCNDGICALAFYPLLAIGATIGGIIAGVIIWMNKRAQNNTED